jgi:hypothetical protein
VGDAFVEEKILARIAKDESECPQWKKLWEAGG